MKDEFPEHASIGPGHDDKADVFEASGGPVAAKAVVLPDFLSGLGLGERSHTFDVATSNHRKLPENIDTRHELIFGRTSSAPIPYHEGEHGAATRQKSLAEELIEAIKEPFDMLTRHKQPPPARHSQHSYFVQ